MADQITLYVKAAQLAQMAGRVEEWAIRALREAARPVEAKVRDLTPRWQGGLVRSVNTKTEDAGRTQNVNMPDSVVANVHENNGTWSKQPPSSALVPWVEGKLGIAGKRARGVAFVIARKIKARGLTLPNREGRGQMFKRTFDLMNSTGAHIVAFKAALRQNARV